MATDSTNSNFSHHRRHDFSETRWSVVIAAGQKSSPGAAAALDALCRRCWYPIYAYVRRRGYGAHDAQDLTQEFFARILRDNSFARADPQKGKFRTYLLGALNHFLADEWDKARAQKRGSGEIPLSLQDQTAEQRYLQEPATELTPEKVYDKRWGMILLEHALQRVREEFMAAGKGREFELLKGFLNDRSGPGGYDEIAGQLGVSANSVAVTVHRLRLRFRALIRAEVAETVLTSEEVDQELRHLFFR